MIKLLDGVTDTDAIRAVVGVSEDSRELTDEYFTSRRVEGALRLELSRWLPATLEVLEDAADAADEGDDAILIWDAVQQAATYWCAWEVLKSAPVALFQQISDGQNEVKRPELKHKELLDLLFSSYSGYKGLAVDLFSPTTATTYTASWLAGKSSPSFDPVTGA
jgi:hypothetical protein